MTTLAIFAERDGLDLTGSYFSVEKNMSADAPRRIVSLPLVLHLPRAVSEDVRPKLERVAHTCPVQRSLHPDVQTDIAFMYDV